MPSEKPVIPALYPEDGENVFLRNYDIHQKYYIEYSLTLNKFNTDSKLPDYMVSHSTLTNSKLMAVGTFNRLFKHVCISDRQRPLYGTDSHTLIIQYEL
jgi:hypothetical protein